MNSNQLKTIVVLASIALVGMLLVQVYWINNAITVAQQRFDQNVNAALNNVAKHLEKQKVAAKITQKFRYRKQGKSTLAQKDKLLDNDHISIKNDNVITELVEEFTADSAGVEVTKYQQQSRIEGEEPYSKTALNIPAYAQQGVDNLMSKRESMVNEIIDELVSVNIYNDYNNFIDTLMLDSLIAVELNEMGISADYEYGLSNKHQPLKMQSALYNSKYKVNLSPDNVFITPQYLSIRFPSQQKYLLQSMWLMLSLSTVLMLAVIFAFYYAVSTIVKQKKLSDIKNDFISNMTHEFKTPISTISLACEVLADADVVKSKDRIDNYVKVIGSENKRLGVLVENILQTAILDKGELKLKQQLLDFHLLIEQTLLSMKLQIESKAAEVTLNLNASDFMVNVDRVHMTSVIFNLIDNALKYSGNTKPVIQIKTINKNGSIVLSIADNGIGISKANVGKIFDTMYRVSTGNVHDVKGFGLGLSYVKTVIDKHGGSIHVESQEGEGTTFKIQLASYSN